MNLLSSHESADLLGISVLTQSDAGISQLRGVPVVISDYRCGRKGPRGIRIAESEVRRLLSLMQATPVSVRRKRDQSAKRECTHITSGPSRPDHRMQSTEPLDGKSSWRALPSTLKALFRTDSESFFCD